MSEEPKTPEGIEEPTTVVEEPDKKGPGRGGEAGDEPDLEVELEPDWLGELSDLEISLQDSPAALEKLGIEAEEEPPKEPAEKPAEEPLKVEEKVEPKLEEEPKKPSEAEEELFEGSDGKRRPRYAHYQREMQIAQNKLKDLGQVQPIAEYILKTPEVLDIVDRKMKGLPLIQPDGVPDVDVVPEEPEPPTRPVNFSLDDAMNNPDSDSYKYEIAIREYPVKLRQWQKTKDRHDEANARVQAEEDAQIEFTDSIQRGLRQAVTSHGKIPAEKVDEVTQKCLKFFSGPDSLKPDVMLRVYLASLAPPVQKKIIEEKADEVKDAKKDLPPAPSGTVEAETGTIVPPLGDDEYVKQMEDQILAPGPF